MTDPLNYSIPTEMMEQIMTDGLDAIPEMMRIIINAAMQAERQQYLGVAPYERGEGRRDQANGYKPKTVLTRMGEITFAVPQVRQGEFYPSALEKGLRSERALKVTLAEMYVQGVSTRKVAAITEQLCGRSVSSSQVSQATQHLDQVLEEWRQRALGQCRYLYLDARYEKVRQAGQVLDAAVLIAMAVTAEGKRTILGLSVSLSEAEVHWRTFLQSLVERGLSGVELIISDAHPGLNAARKAVFGGLPWQRCQFHFQQNAQAYLPKKEMQAEAAADLRAIFNAPNREQAQARLNDTIKKYTQSAPNFCRWLEDNCHQALTVFDFPQIHQRFIRTSNPLERLNREIKRRTRVVSIFPNEQACLRLISAFLMETSDEWETGRTYLSFDNL